MEGGFPAALCFDKVTAERPAAGGSGSRRRR
jgi:hypothetical protein